MNMLITTTDKKRLDAIRKDLGILGSRESTFLRVELLFYEALTLAKNYGENAQMNTLLGELRKVQAGAHEKTKEICRTSVQKERLIHQFIVQFKKAISGKVGVS